MERTIGKPLTHVSTSDLSEYLNGYESSRAVGKVAIDNIRRIFSSFFAWLEEDYIMKSPTRRIHWVKTADVAKRALDDEQLEALRDGCKAKRDLALIDIDRDVMQYLVAAKALDQMFDAKYLHALLRILTHGSRPDAFQSGS